MQKTRNEIGDLDARAGEIRAQQQALQSRLAPIVEKRRSIEQLFADLESRQYDVDRTLAEIGGGDDAVALNVRLKKMIEFVRASDQRCDEVERASKVIAGLREDFVELQKRLAPFAAAADGVAMRVKELEAARSKLAEEIGSLEQTPLGPLSGRVQQFADAKHSLENRLSLLADDFSRLATLRNDIAALFEHCHRALDALGQKPQDGAVDIDARVEELAAFISVTQTRLDDIEHRAAGFAQLKNKLGDLQSRLQPLQAVDGGVASLLRELREDRDQLFAKIRQIEEDDDGDLAERLKKLSDTKRELEERVSGLTEQFSKLATLRRDIAGLFEKLSGAVNASAN